MSRLSDLLQVESFALFDLPGPNHSFGSHTSGGTTSFAHTRDPTAPTLIESVLCGRGNEAQLLRKTHTGEVVVEQNSFQRSSERSPFGEAAAKGAPSQHIVSRFTEMIDSQQWPTAASVADPWALFDFGILPEAHNETQLDVNSMESLDMAILEAESNNRNKGYKLPQKRLSKARHPAQKVKQKRSRALWFAQLGRHFAGKNSH